MLKETKNIVINKNYYSKLIFEKIIYFFSSFFISQVCIFNNYYLFGVCLLSSVNFNNYYNYSENLTVLIGSVLGYLVTLKLHMSMKYISSLVLICALKYLISDFKNKKINNIIYAPIITFFSLIITNIFINISGRFDRYKFFVNFLEAILASIVTYFFSINFKILSKKNINNINLKEFVYIIINLSIFLLPVLNISIFRISLGKIIYLVLILLISYVSGVIGGVISGTVFGLIFNLNNINSNYVFSTYSVSGLMSGLFNYMGKLGTCVIFIISSVIMSIMYPDVTEIIIFLYELTISVIIFLLLPDNFIIKTKKLLSNIINTKNINIKKKLTKKYNIDYYITQHNCNNQDFCGDSYKYFEDNNQNFNIIISDGMGTGQNAHIESNSSSELLKFLSKNNINFENCIEILNYIMLLNSENLKKESLVTFDIFSFDLCTGNANIIKAGAPSSYLIRDKNIQKINSSSLPIGILNNTSCTCEKLKLYTGDWIIMCSDGVTDLGEEFINNLLKNIFLNNIIINTPENISKYILNSTINFRKNSNNHDDDITVISIKINSK